MGYRKLCLRAGGDESCLQNRDESTSLIGGHQHNDSQLRGGLSVSAFANQGGVEESLSRRRRLGMALTSFGKDFRALPWTRYFNMPTIAALAGLSVG